MASSSSPSTTMTTTMMDTSSTLVASSILDEINNMTMVVIPIHYSRPATIFAAACASIFTVVGIMGNLLTVVALLRCAKLRSHATTMFVISLALSDLLFAAVNLPLTASRYVHERWILGDVLCRMFPFFFYGNVAASLMNMVAITINRYVLISCHAHYGRIYSQFNIYLMIASVWIFSFGMLVPPLVEIWGSFGLNEASFSCTILKKNGSSPKKFLMLFGFLMPCLVIICCYSAIFCKVRQSRRNVQSHLNSANLSAAKNNNNNNSVQSAQRREDIRLTNMMLTIFLCFLICFLPLMLVNVADDEVRYPTLHIIASVLAWASAVINPFIYAFKNRQYQQAFTKVLCRQSHPGANGPRNVSNPSKTSASKTFLTDILHFNTAAEKVRMVRNNLSGGGGGGGGQAYKPTTEPASELTNENNATTAVTDNNTPVKKAEIIESSNNEV